MTAHREKCTILENKKIAPGHFVLRMCSPRISKAARPGQFVQVLCSDSFDPLLPRPFSFLTATTKDFSILYQVVGKGTHLLAQAQKGDALWVVGPLGNGFATYFSLRGAPVSKRPGPSLLRPIAVRGNMIFVLIGGGVGIPPLYHLAQHFLKLKPRINPENIQVFLGARTQSLLLCEKDFKKLGIKVEVATEDGSKGAKGYVTKMAEDFVRHKDPRTLRVYACGPTSMLKAVSLISEKYGVRTEVSVEVPMACGFGACLGCAIRVKEKRTKMRGKKGGKNHRFAMACTEGPVFLADQILWD